MVTDTVVFPNISQQYLRLIKFEEFIHFVPQNDAKSRKD